MSYGSPEQQYSKAKMMPIGELAKVLQGQSDAVEQWVAESVLRQKVQMQKAQQGAAALPMAQSPKVVQQDLAQAQQLTYPHALQQASQLAAQQAQQQAIQPRADMGIGAVPAPNMEQMGEPQMMAAGGIVAFDDGGPVQHFQTGGSPASRWLNTFGEKQRQSVAERTPGMLDFYNQPLVTPELAERDRLRRLIEQQYRTKANLIGMFKNQSDEERAFAQDVMSRLPNMSLDEMRALAGPNLGFGQGRWTPEVKPRDIAGSPTASEDVDRMVASAAAAKSPRGPAPTEGVAPTGIAGTLPKGLLDQLFPAKKVPTIQDVIEEQKAFDKAYGVDPNVYNKMRTEYEKDKAADAEAKREAGWSRLLEAGLGIMGGESPYALTNIGKGAQAAAKGAMDDIREFRKLDKERAKAMHELNLAENAFKRTGSAAAQAKLQHAEDKAAQVDLERSKAGADIYRTIYTANAPSATERVISRMGDPRFAAQAKQYFDLQGSAKLENPILQHYAKNPMALELLKSTDPNLYNSIKAQLNMLAVPSASSSPTGKVRD